MKRLSIMFGLLVCLLASGAWAASRPIPNPPQIDATSYYLVDYDSGQVLAEKDPDKAIEPASITKLMTAYLVFKAIDEGDVSLDEDVTISEKAWRMKGSKMFVEVGKQVKVEDLLRGLIIQSGNDASVALAEHVAGSESAFAGYMNHQARLLGMQNSNFVNSTGWPDENHYSSARDIAILARAIIRDFPDSYQLYSEKEFTYNEIRQFNRNRLLWRDESVDGVKTGHTESAGYCLVVSALRGDMRLISVVIGTKSDKARTQSSQSMLNYGFRFFETHRLYRAQEVLQTTRIWYGAQEQVNLGVDRDIHITIPRGRYGDLDASMEVDSRIEAPVTQGQQLGKVNIRLDEELIVSENIVAMQPVDKGSLFARAMDSIKLMFQ
ncbi:MAG: D-alanyl-D-alanine carboxypeptidase family protein [Gammaproteobacteria bacterium]|nr:D-alanyl-D-alanine carboxypeptidase family protein [Gammaproteobacteria bacterium]